MKHIISLLITAAAVITIAALITGSKALAVIAMIAGAAIIVTKEGRRRF